MDEQLEALKQEMKERLDAKDRENASLRRQLEKALDDAAKLRDPKAIADHSEGEKS